MKIRYKRYSMLFVFLFLSMHYAFADEFYNYYDVLGVSSDATVEEIRKAYLRRAFEWHPDKNKDRIDRAHEMFKIIHEAYAILSDDEKRKKHDKEFWFFSSCWDINCFCAAFYRIRIWFEYFFEE